MKENKEINKYALILAGGNGTRLWPISTLSKPKQFLNLYEENIMINETIKRIEPIFDHKNIFVIINKNQSELAERYIDYNIPRENIFSESVAKNTAMCIFYATLKIKKMRGKGIMTILSSDHYIKKEDKLVKNVNEGIEIAKNPDNLVIFGIKPTYPSIGFGYVKFEKDESGNNYIVQEFKQKPNVEKAQEYCESGKYYWNSGMYIWNIDTILENYKQYMPDLYEHKEEMERVIGTKEGIEVMGRIYDKAQSISIDKAILEKSKNIKMIKSEFEWMDIGTINDFFDIQPKDEKSNVKIGNVVTEDSEKTNIFNANDGCLVATIGLKDVNIINCNEVLLIANKNKMNQLPEFLSKMKKDKELKKFL